MRYKLITCEVFTRLACLAIAKSPHTVDIEFTKVALHEDADKLRKEIINKIDLAEERGIYDAILLGYGLCGNSTVGIKSKTLPIVIPRAHDCCTIFLGSKEKFIDNFGENLSAQWSSVGYTERGTEYLRDTDTGRLMGYDKEYDEYVKQYGEENAKYIWEMLHPKIHNDELIFIEIEEVAHLGYKEKMEAYAKKQGLKFRVINGNMSIIERLIYGNWDKKDFLIVPPGKEIKPLYDYELIFKAK